MTNYPQYQQLLDWVIHQARFDQEVDDSRWEYFDEIEDEDQLIEMYDSREAMTHALTRHLEWFAFERRADQDKKTPLEIYLEEEELSTEDGQIFELFKQNFISLFEVKEVAFDQGLVLEDLVTHKVYQVEEHAGSLQAQAGEILITRIFPVAEDKYILGGTGSKFGQEALYTLRLACQHLSDFDQKVPGPEWEKFFQTKSNAQELWQIINQLDDLFKKANVKVEITDIQLELAKTAKNPSPVIQKYCSLYADTIETKNLYALLRQLWELTPQKEFGGLTPHEAKFKEAGPVEQNLVARLFEFIRHNIDWHDYWSDEEKNKDIKKLERRFLDTPKAEIDNQTPRQAILAERKQIGIERQEIGYQVNFEPIGSIEGALADWHNNALKAMQEGDHKRAFNFYQSIIKKTHQDKIDNPELFRAWGNLGICYAALGSEAYARQCFKQALKLRSDYEQAQDNLTSLEKHGVAPMAAEMMQLSLAKRFKHTKHLPEWSEDKLAKTKTRELVAKLTEFIPEFKQDEFLKHTREYESYQKLADEKYYPLSTATGQDHDFIWLAIRELWSRLNPDKPSIEQQVKTIDKLIEASDKLKQKKNKLQKGLAKDRQILAKLLELSTQDNQLKRSRFENIQFYSQYDLKLWLNDFLQDLGQAGLFQEKLDKAKLIHDWLGDAIFLRHRANAFFRLGKTDEGAKLYEQLIERESNDLWLLIDCGNDWWETDLDLQEKSQKALDYYQQAESMLNDLRTKHKTQQDFYTHHGRTVFSLYNHISSVAVAMDDQALIKKCADQMNQAVEYSEMWSKQAPQNIEDLSPDKFQEIFEQAVDMDMTKILKEIPPPPDFKSGRPQVQYSPTTNSQTKPDNTSSKKVGRNDPCPCGAVKENGRSIKYKHCCGK